MTNKGILYLVLGSLSAVGGLVALTAISNAEAEASNSVKNDLLKNSDDYSRKTTELSEVKVDLKKLDDFYGTERSNINNSIDAWKETSGYSEKIRDARVESSRKLNDFKESIGYDAELKNIDTEFEEAVGKVKEHIGYDEKIDSQKKLIADANKAYDTAVFFMEDNQASKAAKKAARKAKDKTIDTANERIDELDKILKKEVKGVKKEFEEKKAALEKRVTDKKSELDKIVEEKNSKLNEELNTARNKIIFLEKENRTDEFKRLIENEKSLKSRKSDLEKELKEAYENAYNSLTRDEMLISYLKDNNIKAPVVALVGVITGAPLIILSYEYMAKLYYILKRI